MTRARSAGKTWLGLFALALLGACGGSDDMASPKPQAPSDTSMAGASAGEPASETFNGCSQDSYDDHSGPDDARVIRIAANGLTFTPKCLLIAAGQNVRFEGSLSSHPLSPGNPEDASAGSPDNPITATSSGMSVEFDFESAGTFPYFCELHAFGNGMGMAGAVLVR